MSPIQLSLLLAVLLLNLGGTAAIRCYSCYYSNEITFPDSSCRSPSSSSTSKEENCNVCAKYYKKFWYKSDQVEVIQRSCFDLCFDILKDPSMRTKYVQLSCCTTDLCNGARGPLLTHTSIGALVLALLVNLAWFVRQIQPAA